MSLYYTSANSMSQDDAAAPPSLAPAPSTATPASPSDPKGTIARVYNKYLIDLVMGLKSQAAGGAQVKKALKEAGHMAIDPSTSAHVEHALSTLPRKAVVSLDPSEVLADASVLAFEPLRGVSLGALLCIDTGGKSGKSGKSDNSNGNGAVHRGYLYTLVTLCIVYSEVRDSGDGSETLVSNVLEVLSRVQAGDAPDEALDGIMEDDVVAVLERLADVTAEMAADRPAPELDDVMKSLESSKIADLAKEISSEIDMSKIASMENPMDLLNFSNMTDSNSVLGNIVSKVGSKIQSKLANGEMRHDELLSDAVSLLKAFDTQNAFGGNPLFSSVLDAAKSGKMNFGNFGGGGAGGGGAAKSGGVSAREKLRQKLERQRDREQKAAAAASSK